MRTPATVPGVLPGPDAMRKLAGELGTCGKRRYRSIKILASGVNADREDFVVQLPLGDGRAKVEHVAASLAVRTADIADVLDVSSQADRLILGYESTEEGCRYKLYLECTSGFDTFDGPTLLSGQRLIHVAIKWTEGQRRPTRAWYVAPTPVDRPAALRRHVADAFGDRPDLVDWAFELLDRSDDRPVPLLVIHEQRSARRSVDISVRHLDLSLSDALAHARPVLDRLEISRSTLDAARPERNGERASRVGIGLDRCGQPFLTVFHDGPGAGRPRPARP